ncbi:MAG TPA: hypothetical protein VN132_16540 [Bdellovibrio sp.]|nr:hypothetical protein [Bdellovibrio sp.]
MTRFLTKIFLSTLLLSPLMATAKTISDSFVENLRCEGLSVDSVFKSIREDAFSSDRHMPYENFEFSYRLMPLASCWSMSHLQRLMFYFGRFNEQGTVPSDLERVQKMKAWIRGQGFDVLKFRDLTAFEYYKEYGTGFFIENEQTFKKEIEADQVERLFNSKNEKYLASDGSRGQVENQKTFGRIVNDLNRKRLPLLILRRHAWRQHVVVVKSYQEDGLGNYEFTIYDPNSPRPDGSFSIDYSSRIGEFSAPQLYSTVNPIGAFLVNEEEMPLIEQGLLNYYKKLCR